MRIFDAVESRFETATAAETLRIFDDSRALASVSSVRFVVPKFGLPGFGAFLIEKKNSTWERKHARVQQSAKLA
jgi:hypothetical protein